MSHPHQLTATASSRRGWWATSREVAAERINQVVFVVVATAIGLAYSILLPFNYTQRISFANWGYLDSRYLFFAVAFALGMAWVLTLQVHAMRRITPDTNTAHRSGLAGAAAALASLLPSFLCCSPVVPTVVSVLGLSAATRLRTTGRIQYFFATRQDWLLVGALVLLVLSCLWSTRKLARARCLADECTDASACATSTPDPAEQGADEPLPPIPTRQASGGRR